MQSLVANYKLSQTDLDKQCDDELLITLMEKIESFSDIAPYFKLTTPEINEIQLDNNTERTRKLGMLTKWRDKNGSDATYLSIVSIFLYMENRRLAEIVLQHVKDLKQKEVSIFIKIKLCL